MERRWGWDGSFRHTWSGVRKLFESAKINNTDNFVMIIQQTGCLPPLVPPELCHFLNIAENTLVYDNYETNEIRAKRNLGKELSQFPTIMFSLYFPFAN